MYARLQHRLGRAEGSSSFPGACGAFFGVLYTLFDRHLWRNGFVCKLGLVKIPNLAGCWRGYLISSFDGKRHNLVINIFQTWTQLAVFLATTTSISRSCAAA